MSGHTEPYDARRLIAHLERCGAVPRPRHGGGQVTYCLPHGAEVTVPVNGVVPSSLARRVAEVIGQTYADLRSSVGHPIVNAGRPKPVVKKTAPKGASKADVLSAITAIRRSLVDVEHAVKPGVRDSEFYRRVLEDLGVVMRSADRAVSQAQGVHR